MSMLTTHAEARDSANVIYHEFLLRYRPHAHILYGHVEGKEDPMFYRGFIEHSLPAGWEVELFRGGNKGRVLEAAGEFDWTRFSRRRVCFFVDRDLSAFLEAAGGTPENVYVTDQYSIENDVVTFGTAKRLLEEVFGLVDLAPEETAALRQNFDDGLARLKAALAPLMAQVILWRRNGQRPFLNEIQLRDWFEFSNGALSVKPEHIAPDSIVLDAAHTLGLTASTAEDRSNAEREFSEQDGVQKFIRGKYLMWFLVEFALHTHQAISEIFPRFARPPKLRVTIGQANSMIIVAPRARCPQSLREFIARTFLEFTRTAA